MDMPETYVAWQGTKFQWNVFVLFRNKSNFKLEFSKITISDQFQYNLFKGTNNLFQRISIKIQYYVNILTKTVHSFGTRCKSLNKNIGCLYEP